MGLRQYVEPIDELVDLGIDTVSYAVGDNGSTHAGV